MTDLMRAVKADDLEAVRSCLAEGADVNEPDAAGDWPVIFAAYLGHVGVLKVLLESGADLTVVDPGMKATALHAAAYAGHAEACQLLIDHGINIDQQGPYNGYTALHDAVWQSNLQAAAVLVKAGANRGIKGNNNQTPLDLARSNHSRALVELLEGTSAPEP